MVYKKISSIDTHQYMACLKKEQMHFTIKNICILPAELFPIVRVTHSLFLPFLQILFTPENNL